MGPAVSCRWHRRLYAILAHCERDHKDDAQRSIGCCRYKSESNRELALAMVDSAGSFRGLVIFFTAAGVFVWAWLCGTVYIFSYGGVFGPSALPRRYTPASMISRSTGSKRLPFLIFVGISSATHHPVRRAVLF